MSDHTVAIVVPLLNEAKNLPQLFQLLDGLDADEIILVDGGSEDGTPELLGKSPFRWLQSARGRTAQMNAGAALCQSETILFLHADTEIDADSFAVVRDVMENRETVGGRFDLKLSGSHPMLRLIELMINLRSRLTKISTGDQAMFVKRCVFEELKGFPDQPLMEDVEFCKRLKRQGRVICLHEKVTTSSRRWEQSGMIRTILLMWKLRFLYWAGISPERLAKVYHDAR